VGVFAGAMMRNRGKKRPALGLSNQLLFIAFWVAFGGVGLRTSIASPVEAEFASPAISVPDLPGAAPASVNATADLETTTAPDFSLQAPPIAPIEVSLASAPTTTLTALDADPDAADHAAVPLPTGFWTGLSALAGLGIIRPMRFLRWIVA